MAVLDEELRRADVLPVVEQDAVRRFAVAPGAEKAPKLAAAIKAWESQVDALDRGEITPEEYESWKMGIGGC